MDDVLECPFCNHKETRVETSEVGPEGHKHSEHAVLCLHCGAMGGNAMTHDMAIKLWNMRRGIQPGKPKKTKSYKITKEKKHE